LLAIESAQRSRDRCRVCAAPVTPFMSFGPMPIANGFCGPTKPRMSIFLNWRRHSATPRHVSIAGAARRAKNVSRANMRSTQAPRAICRRISKPSRTRLSIPCLPDATIHSWSSSAAMTASCCGTSGTAACATSASSLPPTLPTSPGPRAYRQSAHSSTAGSRRQNRRRAAGCRCDPGDQRHVPHSRFARGGVGRAASAQGRRRLHI
jgi:hypothetical protein